MMSAGYSRAAADRLNDWKVDREENRYYHTAHHHKDRRLKRGRQLLESDFRLGVVENGDFIEHLAQTAGTFADTDHVDRERGHPVRSFQTLCKRASFANHRQDRRTAASQLEIRDRLRGDLPRFDERD